MTTIAAVMARSYTSHMFDDLTDPDLSHTRTLDKQTGVTTLVFAGELDGATEDAIRDRMTSRNDADQAARDVLRERRDALVEGDTMRLVIDYVLGESS